MRHFIPAFALLLLASPLAAQQAGLPSDSPAPSVDRQTAPSVQGAPSAATAGESLGTPVLSSSPVTALPGSGDAVIIAAPSSASPSQSPSAEIAPARSAEVATAPATSAAPAPQTVPMQSEK